MLGVAMLALAPPALAERWERAIRTFEAADAERPPEPGTVLFVGSSSIRLWRLLEQDMAPLPVLNRGFGGATLADVVRYLPRFVLPHDWSAIVLYAGENDLVGPETGADADHVAELFRRFVDDVRAGRPNLPVVYLAIKPSPARFGRWAEMSHANRLIESYASADPGVFFVDVASDLLASNGAPLLHLYAPDRVHLSRRGYERWRSIIRPHLQDILSDPAGT